MSLLLRGHLIDFPDDAPARVIPDGSLLIEDGRIAAVGPGLTAKQVVDHRPHYILPGFVDPHIHFPQVQVIASWAAQLLDWLHDYTFPAEARYADPVHAARMAEAFCDLLLAHGTTSACAFCSSDPTSAEALFAAAEARGMAMVAGKVMMDRGAIPVLHDTPQRAHDETEALIARWHGRGRLQVAITPRFAITSTPAQLEVAGALAAAHPGLPVQTHLSENAAEIALTLQLYPGARDYLDVYDRAGLLGPRSLMGHAIHLSPREVARMAETGTRAIHCPTSNLFLGSGLFDGAALEGAGVVTGVATDVGGGTSYSMLQTLAEAYKVAQMKGRRLHPFETFRWATRGNAEALGLADRLGRLAPGYDADLVVLDPRATPAMALRAETVRDAAEELFILQTLGDDRAVRQTYVAGRAMKPASLP